MGSHNLRITIERYPDGNPVTSHSWGCPELNLMGYTDLGVLLIDVRDELHGMVGK